MTPPPCVRHAGVLATLLLGLALVPCGCSDGTGSVPAAESGSVTAEQRIAEVERRVDAVIAASRAATERRTIDLSDGATVDVLVAKPRDVDFERGTWTPSGLTAETPGEMMAALEFGDAPTRLLIDDSGTVLLAGHDGLRKLAKPGAPELMLPGEISFAGWNTDGTALILSGGELKRVLDWPSATPRADLSTVSPEGRLMFAPTGDGLWDVVTHIQFDPNQPVRVVVELQPLNAQGQPSTEAPIGVRGASWLETLPQLGAAWVHERTPYQLQADPGPLFLLGDDFRSGARLTNTDTAVDWKASADRHGRVCFLRAERIPDSGIGPSTRAWMTYAEQAGAERMLTAEMTTDVAISPSGEWIAAGVVREGQVVVLRMKREELEARDLSAQVQAARDLRDGAQRVLDSLRMAFAQTPMGRPPEPTPEGLVPTSSPPDEGSLMQMAAALREALARDTGVTVPSGVQALGVLDDYLSLADGVWPEEGATLAALAGIYIEDLVEAGGARLFLDEATGDLSASTEVPTQSDDAGVMTLHLPFLVARERLAGRMSLDASARDVLAAWPRPIVLLENAGAASLDALLWSLAAEVGITPENVSPALLESAATGADVPPTVLLMARRAATLEQDAALELVIDLRLAEQYPANGWAIMRLGRSAWNAEAFAAAERAFLLAAELGAADGELLVEVASGLMDCGRGAEAMPLLERAERISRAGATRIAAREYLEQLASTGTPP